MMHSFQYLVVGESDGEDFKTLTLFASFQTYSEAINYALTFPQEFRSSLCVYAPANVQHHQLRERSPWSIL